MLLLAFKVLSSDGFEYDLKCDNRQESWDVIGYTYTCRAYDLSISSRDSTVSSLNGEHILHEKLEALKIESQTIYYLPKGLAIFFPTLKALQVERSELKSIEKSDLEPFPDLQVLMLRDNRLRVLPSNLFERSLKLCYITFTNNRLIGVEKNLLSNLQQRSLQQAYFQDCQCINTYASSQYEISSLIDTLESECAVEDIKTILSGKEIGALQERITHFEAQTKQLQKQISTLLSCDGNLNTATKNLLMVSKSLDTCEISLRSSPQINLETLDIEVRCSDTDDDRAEGLETECSIVNFKVNSPNVKIDRVINKNDGAVDRLIIFAQETLFLPTNLADFFGKLDFLSVTYSGLYQIDDSTFKGMENLTTLILSNNKLIEIPVDAFTHQENLLTLDLSFNNIQSLSNEVFRPLKNIKSLNLNGNSLHTISAEVFEDLKHLSKLLLQNNKLKFISANLLSPLNLSSVDFSNNICINMSHPTFSLNEITEAIIDKCIAPIELTCIFENDETNDVKAQNDESATFVCKAQELVIEYPKTKILKFNGNESIDSSNVTVFTVTDQSIKFLPFELSKIFPDLESIIIERSKLTSLLSFDFRGLSKLKRIEIRHNNLSSIEAGTFDDISRLEFLDLSFNAIKSLPSKIFSQLVHAKTLNLSNNELETLTPDLLPRKNLIEEFLVNNNQLEMIETKILRLLRRSKKIDLTANLCIDLKYEVSDNTSKTLIELSGAIDLNCSTDY